MAGRVVGTGLVLVGSLLVSVVPGWSQEEGGLVVDKVVDTNGDGVFADLEEARASSPATFRVTLANTTDRPLEVTSVVDVLRDATLDLLAMPECTNMAEIIEPQAESGCTFTIDRYLRTYAAQPRRELTNRVEASATDGSTTFAGWDEATVVNPNADVVSVEVELTTDADGDGTFTDDEQAPAPGADVPVRITVQNTSPGSVVLRALTGEWAGAGPVEMLPVCPGLDGMRLRGIGGGHGDGHDDHDDGGHDDGHDDDGHDGHAERPTNVTCETIIVGHAPAAGTEVVDRVTATLAKQHSPERSASDTDDARVWVAAAPVPDLAVELRVGPAGGPVGDHDEAPGPSIPLPGGQGVVDLQVEVRNPGEVPLEDLVVSVSGLDLGACALPTTLSVGESAVCDLEDVPGRPGPQALEAAATAIDGAGSVVEASDPAHYLGVAVDDEDEVRPEPTPTVTPTPSPPPPTVTAPPTAAPAPTTTVAASGTLPHTGAPAGLLVGGAVSLLAGLVLLGVTGRRARPTGG